LEVHLQFQIWRIQWLLPLTLKFDGVLVTIAAFIADAIVTGGTMEFKRILKGISIMVAILMLWWFIWVFVSPVIYPVRKDVPCLDFSGEPYSDCTVWLSLSSEK
jgi:hypothetical protein